MLGYFSHSASTLLIMSWLIWSASIYLWRYWIISSAMCASQIWFLTSTRFVAYHDFSVQLSAKPTRCSSASCICLSFQCLVLHAVIEVFSEIIFPPKEVSRKRWKVLHKEACLLNNSIVHVKVSSEMVLSFWTKKEKEPFLYLEI